MEVFLIRHATRNFTMGDVPLNSEGADQAMDLIEDENLKGLKSLLASPKKRAKMTLDPLAGQTGVKIETLNELDQMDRNETEKNFSQRVKWVLDRIEKGHWPTPLIACTHSDWLSTAMRLIPSDSSDLKYSMFQCCDYMKFSIEDGIWYLKKSSKR